MTKNTDAVSATAIATWSNLLKKRGTGSFLPATTNIVVSTMMLPSLDMAAETLSQWWAKFHPFAASLGVAKKRDPVRQANAPFQLEYRSAMLTVLAGAISFQKKSWTAA